MLSSGEMNIVNLNPWRYQDQGNDRRWRAPRSQPNMEGEIDRDYYDDDPHGKPEFNAVVGEILKYVLEDAIDKRIS